MNKITKEMITPINGRLVISFSGGKTSAMMTKMILDAIHSEQMDIDTVVLFANTGAEHQKTLDFVKDCDDVFGFETIWVEAVVHHDERVSSSHKIVNYKTASRNGEPYEESVKKYGIFNPSNPSCTQKVKINPMNSYLRGIGWGKGSYSTAIGIRADEIDRMSTFAMKEYGAIYPLVKANITNHDVAEWGQDQPFNLEIPEHYGNCTWCWKKSKRKLLTIAQDDPSAFDLPKKLEALYKSPSGEDSAIYRNHQTTISLLDEARLGQFARYKAGIIKDFQPYFDLGGSCGQSCEIFADKD